MIKCNSTARLLEGISEMKQRSFLMFIRRLALFVILPVTLVHLVTRIMYNIVEANSSAIEYVCGRYVSGSTIISLGGRLYTKADCEKYSSVWSYVTNYEVPSPVEFIVTHAWSAAILVLIVLLSIGLYHFGYFILTGESLSASKVDDAECAHNPSTGDSDWDVYCTNKDCSCVVHTTEEFTTAWIPKQD